MAKRVIFFAAAVLSAALLCGCGADENTDVKVRPGETEKITEEPASSSQITEYDYEELQSSEAIVTDTETSETEASSEVSTSDTQDDFVPDVISENPQDESDFQMQSAPSVLQNGEVEPTYINGILIVNKTYPLPESYAPGTLTSETQAAFEHMQSAAWEDGGLNLWVQSGYRSYSYQYDLYNSYLATDDRETVDTYSARPGHSEHQTGLAFDLNTIDDSFAYTDEGKWVAENCYKYGFIVRYPKEKEALTGYKYEPWHLRYLGVELATDVYNSGLCLEEYLGITSEYSY